VKPEGGDSLRAELVVVSDVHLRTIDDARSLLLRDALRRLDPAVEHLVLNGDIFDFCSGDAPYYRAKFAPLGEELATIAARGTRVTFVEGNHEIGMRQVGWPGVEVVDERDLVVALKSGTRIKVCHGDLIIDDPWYRAFRGLIKSRVGTAIARTVPGSWIDAYAMKHASISRSQDKYRTLDHGRILAAFDRWLAEGACEHGIIGHFHVPYAEPRPGGGGCMMSVESWDRPNFLLFGDGVFARTYPKEKGAPFVVSPAESVFKAS